MSVTTTTWWTEPFRMFQTNLREVDSDLNVDATLDAIIRHGANVWLIGAGGIVSHYPTSLSYQRESAHLARRASGDLVGDALTAAHDRGIKLIARFDFSKVDIAIAEQNPGWAFVDAEGEWQVYNGLVSTCPAAGYLQEGAFEVLREFFAKYPVDGLFFNMMMFPIFDYSYRWRGACFCDSCRSAFADFSGGKPIPTDRDSADFAQWQQWSATVMRDLDSRFRALVADAAPQAAFFSGPESAVAFHEANNAVGRAFWPFETSQAVSELRARHDPRPVVVNSVAFLDMVYRYAAEEPERYAQYAVQALSRGGNPSVYIMGAPGGTVEYESVSAVADVFAFHRDHAEQYRDTRSAAPIALVRHHPSLVELLATAFLGGAKQTNADAEYKGWYQALQQTHTPFDVVRIEDLNGLAANGELSRYRGLILPDLGSLPADVAEALDSYVREGGTLVATGTSGFEGGRTQLAGSPATSVSEVVTEIEALRNSYAGPAQPGNSEHGPYEGPLLPIIGSHSTAAWAEDADHVGQILSAAPFGPPEKCYGNVPLPAPSYAVRTFGEGKSIYVPWTAGASFSISAMRVIRDFLAEIVDLLLVNRPLVTDLPEQVEITVLQNNAGVLIHLVNHTGIAVGGYGQPVPLSGYSLRVPGELSEGTVRALVSGDTPTLRHEDGWTHVTLPTIERFEVLQLSTAE